MSTSRVSIILTAPSDEDASTLMGTRFVIDSIFVRVAGLSEACFILMATSDGSTTVEA